MKLKLSVQEKTPTFKGQPTEYENMFTSYTSDKGLVSGVDKERKKQSNNNTHTKKNSRKQLNS